MRHILRTLAVLLLLATMVTSVPPGVNAAPVGEQVRAPVEQQQFDSRIEAALKVLETNPAGIGSELAKLARTANPQFADFSVLASELGNPNLVNALALFLSLDQTTRQVLVNGRFADSTPEVTATLIAHEAIHLKDRIDFGEVIDTGVGCFETEVHAFATHVQVWKDLLARNPALAEGPGTQLLNEDLVTVGVLSVDNPDPKSLSAEIIKLIEGRYAASQCLPTLGRDLSELGIDLTLLVSPPSGVSALPGTTNPDNPGPSGSTGSSSIVPGGTGITGQSSGSSSAPNPGASANPGNPSNSGSLPNQLPKSGGAPFSAAEMVILAGGLVGAGLGLRRLVRR